MRITLSVAVLLAVMYVPAWSLVQPDSVPGPIDVSIVQEFPPIADIISKPAQDVPVYGVYAWHTYFNGPTWPDSIDNVGFRTLRVSSGETNVPAEEMMLSLGDRDFEIMYTLNPKARGEFGAYTDGEGNVHEGNDQLMVDDFILFVDTMLTRYGPEGTFFDEHPELPYRPILHWEIANEPNLYYLTGAADWDSLWREGKAKLYAKILVQSYAFIRSKPKWDPVKVIGFSACGVAENDVGGTPPGFIEMCFQADTMVAHSYDIMSNHPYVKNRPPDSECISNQWLHYSMANSFKNYRQSMDNYGGHNKPVWFTEIGWHRDDDLPAGTVGITEQIQAAYVTRLYATAMRLGVERVHVMFLRDGDGFNGGFFSNDDRSRRQSAYATEFMISLMPNPKLAGVISDGADGYYAQQYRSDHNVYGTPDVTMVWNVEKPITVDVPVNAGGEYAVYDMLGAETMARQTVNSTTLSLDIGPCPVYVKEFITSSVTGPADPDVPVNGIAVTPRPFTDGVTLSFTMKRTAQVEIAVINAAGEVMARPLDGIAAAGRQYVRVDALSDAAPGVYLYTIDVDGCRMTGSFIKVQ